MHPYRQYNQISIADRLRSLQEEINIEHLTGIHLWNGYDGSCVDDILDNWAEIPGNFRVVGLRRKASKENHYTQSMASEREGGGCKIKTVLDWCWRTITRRGCERKGRQLQELAPGISKHLQVSARRSTFVIYTCWLGLDPSRYMFVPEIASNSLYRIQICHVCPRGCI